MEKKWPYWIGLAWRYVLRKEGIIHRDDSLDAETDWLDRPAMMQIAVSSPAVLGRLKHFARPYDFVLAPIVKDRDMETQAEKPILVTRYNKAFRPVAVCNLLQCSHWQALPHHDW